MLGACARIAADGVPDYFSFVAGSSATLAGPVHIAPPMFKEVVYNAPLGQAIGTRTGLTTIITGRINQPQDAERIIACGQADLCGMTRAMICDPDMANKAQSGRVDDIRACIGSNQACIGHFHDGYQISCIQNPVSGRELRFGAFALASPKRRVLVAGGVPGWYESGRCGRLTRSQGRPV